MAKYNFSKLKIAICFFMPCSSFSICNHNTAFCQVLQINSNQLSNKSRLDSTALCFPFDFTNNTSDSNKIRSSILFIDSLHSRYITYYFNSEIIREIYFCKNNLKGNCILYGPYLSFYSTGMVAQQGYYNDSSQAIGLWINYYPNGTLSEIVSFSNGKRQGLASIFYNTGCIKEQGYFVNNAKDGEWIEYHKNGKIKSKGTYWPKYKIITLEEHNNISKLQSTPLGSQIMLEFPYTLYYKDGEWKYFNSSGEVEHIEYYKQGQLISK